MFEPPSPEATNNVSGLDAAVKSAIFYYIGCSPCRDYRHKYKRKQQAKRDLREREKILEEQPTAYHHPLPFSTNPYWTEEIKMGPSLPKKKEARNYNSSQRALASAGKDSATGLSLDGSAALEAMSTTAGTGSTTSGEGWNRKRYQREEEELWGHQQPYHLHPGDISRAGRKIMDAISEATTNAGRLIEAKLGTALGGSGGSGDAGSDSDGGIVPEYPPRNYAYNVPRNPPVNDYHPPVVSNKPLHRDGNHWMLQPPPPAKFMEGKTPVSRTGSTRSSTVGAAVVPGIPTRGRLAPPREGSTLRVPPPTANVTTPWPRQQLLPSEEELIEQVIGNGARRLVIDSRRSRSLSLEGSFDGNSSDDEVFGARRRTARWLRMHAHELEVRTLVADVSSAEEGPGSNATATPTAMLKPKTETALNAAKRRVNDQENIMPEEKKDTSQDGVAAQQVAEELLEQADSVVLVESRGQNKTSVTQDAQ